jgi:hypothetical protein
METYLPAILLGRCSWKWTTISKEPTRTGGLLFRLYSGWKAMDARDLGDLDGQLDLQGRIVILKTMVPNYNNHTHV